MQLQRNEFRLFADYFQFYLWDRAMNPQAPVEFDQTDVEKRIKIGEHVVVVQPERNTTVNVEVELHESAPPFDPESWDHIAAASLHLPSGQLEVHECTGGPVAGFVVEPGWYRVRSLHGGLGTISKDGLDGRDHYRIEMWPSPPADVEVLKQYSGRCSR